MPLVPFPKQGWFLLFPLEFIEFGEPGLIITKKRRLPGPPILTDFQPALSSHPETIIRLLCFQTWKPELEHGAASSPSWKEQEPREGEVGRRVAG